MKQTVASRPVAISLSGGYDSRAVLAMCLALGGKPAIATAGTADATDPRIAMAISREVGLDCRRVEICPEDYLACGRDISRATSGMKSIAHWHTYLYARATGFDPGCIHLVGANGEQVRTYYFDKGILARVANLAPPIAVKHFFRLKFDPKRRLRGVPVESFLQGTGNDCADKVIEACAIEARSANGSFLQRLDRFYTLQRVRHFIGGGIACYQQFNQTTSPFLDSRFVTAGARLSRHDKQCSRFHRSLIARHAPGLLRFPTDDSGLAMADADRAGYWLRKSKETSYSPLRKVLGSAAFRELVIESLLLDQFLIRQTRERLVQAQCNQMLCFLATMHFAAEEAAAATARPADMA